MLTTYFSQGSVATYLRGSGSFNSNFPRISFLNLTLKNYEIWSTFAEVIVKQGAPWSWKVMENDDNVMEFLLLH